MNCDDTSPEDWLDRFAGRCYFYPGRDCPGWQRGHLCARIEERIPLGYALVTGLPET